MGRPTIFPTGTTIYYPDKCENGYTLFCAEDHGVVLINMNGKIVRTWKEFGGFPAKMIPGGYVFGSLEIRAPQDGYQDQARELLNGHDPSGQLRGNKYTVYEAGARVPALVRWPARVAPGTVSGALVSHVDLFASFAGLLEARLPRGAAPDSQGALEAWLGEDPQGREYVIAQANNRALSVRTAEWKYIEPSGGPLSYSWAPGIELGFLSQPQLFHLSEDPAERTDVASQHPDIVARMEAILSAERSKN